ncbi:glycoside hydrolase family 16 protein [Alkalitalea saponilacus]|nr:glycoside hydrolase family 16 protein [Alkalitalea saponilacus]
MKTMKLIAVLCTSLLMSCIAADNGDNSQIRTPDGYALIWSDEFDQDGRVNEKYWEYEEGFVRNEELQWYHRDNVYIKGGILVFEGRREQIENPNFDPNSRNWRRNREFAEYTSGLIKTRDRFSFQYGIMEVRARIDPRKGSWPAIWTLGVDRGWPSGGEVDVMEYYRIDGVPSILANAAWDVNNNYNPKWYSEVIPFLYFLEKDPNWAKEFHIWKMDWTEDYIRIYLDDELLNEIDLNETINYDGFNPFRQPHYILLNLAIGSNGGDPSETDFPILYEVDYVRVFQKIE